MADVGFADHETEDDHTADNHGVSLLVLLPCSKSAARFVQSSQPRVSGARVLEVPDQNCKLRSCKLMPVNCPTRDDGSHESVPRRIATRHKLNEELI